MKRRGSLRRVTRKMVLLLKNQLKRALSREEEQKIRADLLEARVRELEGDLNNFPPYAITACSDKQVREICKKNDVDELVRVMNECFKDIERHDLVCHYILVSRPIFGMMVSLLKESFYDPAEQAMWTASFIKVPDLESVIFLANLKSED